MWNLSQRAGVWNGVGLRNELVKREVALWRWPLLQAAGAWSHRTRALRNALRIISLAEISMVFHPWGWLHRQLTPVHLQDALKLQLSETGCTYTDLVAAVVAGVKILAKFIQIHKSCPKYRAGSFRRLEVHEWRDQIFLCWHCEKLSSHIYKCILHTFMCQIIH